MRDNQRDTETTQRDNSARHRDNSARLKRDIAAVSLSLAGLALTIWGTLILGWGMLLFLTGTGVLCLAVFLSSGERPPPEKHPIYGDIDPHDDGAMEVTHERGPDTT
jgi:hypothetical protein